MARKFHNKSLIRLFPFKREDIVSIQEARQKCGWEVTAFALPSAWKISQGEGVKVAVLDTGADLEHDDLKPNLLPGFNCIAPNRPPVDGQGHGTHVTGIICAANNDIGVVGIAPKAKVIPIKVLDNKGAGKLPSVAAGVYKAVELGADFVVMSLGSPKPVPIVRKAIQFAASKGAVTFCAAGNAGQTRQIFYPAAYPEVIGIGAIDENFKRAKFSCTGPDLDFLAPGVKILSTVPENWYAVLSGTSMANPFAVGVAALVLSYKRKNKLNWKLDTAEDYINLFKQHTTPTSSPEFAGKHFFEGFGIIDPRKLEFYVRTKLL